MRLNRPARLCLGWEDEDVKAMANRNRRERTTYESGGHAGFQVACVDSACRTISCVQPNPPLDASMIELRVKRIYTQLAEKRFSYISIMFQQEPIDETDMSKME